MKLPAHPIKGRAFTLVELLVSMAVVVLLMLVLVNLTDATNRSWRYTTSKVEEFRESRNAFESMTRRLGQATLNTYWDYNVPSLPTKYIRQSELRFISGPATSLTGSTISPTHAVFFLAPLGNVTNTASYSSLNTLLNTCGYFIEFGDDQDLRPPFVTAAVEPYRYRFRLKEMVQFSDTVPGSLSNIYHYTSGYGTSGSTPQNLSYKGNTGYTWFTFPLGVTPRPVHSIAENIIALIILPKLALSDQFSPTNSTSQIYDNSSLAPTYLYDSSTLGASLNPPGIAGAAGYKDLNSLNQIPPLLQVTMVAVDEPSYNRYQHGTTQPSFFANNSFTDATQYSVDLTALQTVLTNSKLTYRVYTTDVSIKAAKWSRAQTGDGT